MSEWRAESSILDESRSRIATALVRSNGGLAGSKSTERSTKLIAHALACASPPQRCTNSRGASVGASVVSRLTVARIARTSRSSSRYCSELASHAIALGLSKSRWIQQPARAWSGTVAAGSYSGVRTPPSGALPSRSCVASGSHSDMAAPPPRPSMVSPHAHPSVPSGGRLVEVPVGEATGCVAEAAGGRAGAGRKGARAPQRGNGAQHCSPGTLEERICKAPNQ